MEKTIIVGLTGHRGTGSTRTPTSGCRTTSTGPRSRLGTMPTGPRSSTTSSDRSATGSWPLRLRPIRCSTPPHIDAILDEIGAVDTGAIRTRGGRGRRPPARRRRLQRIKQGQQIAGVCNGIAHYAELRRRLGPHGVRPRVAGHRRASSRSCTSPLRSSCRSPRGVRRDPEPRYGARAAMSSR